MLEFETSNPAPDEDKDELAGAMFTSFKSED
jgi:hypothetical protein